jgi:hypothetical protein
MATRSKTPWRSLDLYTLDNEEVRDRRVWLTALDEYRRTDTIRDYYLGRVGHSEEREDDVSTWGPSCRDVDWTGFIAARRCMKSREEK